MKRLTLFLFIACCSMNMAAQEYWDGSRPAHRVTLGLRAGMNFSKQYNHEEGADNDFRPGLKAGLEFDLNIVRSLSINTGVYYVQRGYKSKYSDYRGSNTATDNASYIEIPVLLSYRVKLSDAAQFQLNVGPYFGIGLSGTKTFETTFAGQNNYEIDSFDQYDGMKKRDIGIHAGAAVTFSDFYVGVNYERSLMNVSNITGANFQNGSIGLCIGYNFNL